MMPIYLVRWPDLSASLVRAGSEEELPGTLDEVANPEGCEWWVYEGPLFMDFRLPVEWSVRDDRASEPVTPEQIVIDDVGRMATEPAVETIEVSLADCEQGLDTGAEIIRQAFPDLHAAEERLSEDDEACEGEGVLPEGDLRQALVGELKRLIRSSWRRAQLQGKDDPISKLAREMDLPVALAEQLAEVAAKQQADEEDEPEPSEDRPTTPDPLFKVSNHHTASCGQPLTVDGDAAGRYHGYFTNEHGEQAVYVYDYATGEAAVRMGDAGWNNVHHVVDGRLEELLVNRAEATWIRACWLATGAVRSRP